MLAFHPTGKGVLTIMKLPCDRTSLLRRSTAVLAAAAMLLVPLSGCGGGSGPSGGQESGGYTYDTVQSRDLTVSITDSGTLEPADSYTVFCLVSGEILSANFETGDTVSKDDVLYLIDSENIANNVQRAENTLDQRRRAYEDALDAQEDLIIRAPIGGTVTGLGLLGGNRANAGTMVAVIQDTQTLLLTEYYSDDYAQLIYEGMPATVSVSEQMLTLSGTVKQVHSLRRISPTGVSCFAVTVQLDNPGSLTVGTEATCWLNSSQGELYPTVTDPDGLDANDRKSVMADVSGTVEKVHVRDGEIVQAGDVLAELSSQAVEDQVTNAKDSLEDARLSLDSQYDSLDNYTIQAPIDGTIVDKYYKQGENAETGKTLCTIFDLSCLTMTLHIDELDIMDIQVGQTAQITCDSTPDQVYTGTVTEVSINGTTSGGVTTYPVKVQLDQTQGLLPGMNVDAAIITMQKSGALTIPADAVTSGSRVLVKTSDGTTGQGAPQGYDYVKVQLGTGDEDYVEILSGLEAGDQIAWLPDGPAGSTLEMMMGMGMAGHGAQAGGRPGGYRPMDGNR